MTKPMKRKVLEFSLEEEELLIRLVRERPALYDLLNEKYKHKQYRNRQWLDISKILQKSVHECKTRWKSLRDTFNKKKKTASEDWEYFSQLAFLEQNSGLASIYASDATYENVNFDEMHVENDEGENWQNRTDYANQNVTSNANQGNDIHGDLTQNFQQDPLVHIDETPRKAKMKVAPMRKKLAKELKAAKQERLELIKSLCTVEKEHPVEIIFKGLAQTVMTFPPDLAAVAKFRCCQIVSELEYKLHNVESTTGS